MRLRHKTLLVHVCVRDDAYNRMPIVFELRVCLSSHRHPHLQTCAQVHICKRLAVLWALASCGYLRTYTDA